jgi:regulator of replication initiation timing
MQINRPVQPRLALHFDLTPRSSATNADSAFVAACVAWLGLDQGQELSWDTPSNHTLDGGRILRWAPYRHEGSALADIVVHAPDPLDRSLQWSTHVTYVVTTTANGGQHRQVNIRVGTEGGAANSAPPPVRPPRLLSELDAAFTLVSNDGPLQRSPTQLEAGTLDAFVRFVLCDPARTMPVLLLTELPDGGYVLPPEQFAAEMFGLGLCFQLRHSDTFALSDAVGGHARSVFLGSARAYLPGFTLESDPFQHPLVLARALALPGERRRLVQRLAEVSVQRPFSDPAIADTLRDLRATAYSARPDATAALAAAESGVEMDRSQLLAIVRQLEEALRAAEGELARTRERLSETRQQLDQERASARALRTALAAHKERQPIAKPASDTPQSVLEAVERAQALYSDALRIVPSAYASARESEFPDPETAWSYLKALGEVGRRRQDRALGRPLGDVFADLGVDYSPGPSDPARKTPYQFRDGEHEVECADQLRKGSNPATCLRIYFASTEDGGFVIGHVGRQIDTLGK